DMVCCFFFFFQAEDGIRGDLVTGVQSCALPIWHAGRRHEADDRARIRLGTITLSATESPDVTFVGRVGPTLVNGDLGRGASNREIGRASCRERTRARGTTDHTDQVNATHTGQTT